MANYYEIAALHKNSGVNVRREAIGLIADFAMETGITIGIVPVCNKAGGVQDLYGIDSEGLYVEGVRKRIRITADGLTSRAASQLSVKLFAALNEKIISKFVGGLK